MPTQSKKETRCSLLVTVWLNHSDYFNIIDLYLYVYISSACVSSIFNVHIMRCGTLRSSRQDISLRCHSIRLCSLREAVVDGVRHGCESERVSAGGATSGVSPWNHSEGCQSPCRTGVQGITTTASTGRMINNRQVSERQMGNLNPDSWMEEEWKSSVHITMMVATMTWSVMAFQFQKHCLNIKSMHRPVHILQRLPKLALSWIMHYIPVWTAVSTSLH